MVCALLEAEAGGQGGQQTPARSGAPAHPNRRPARRTGSASAVARRTPCPAAARRIAASPARRACSSPADAFAKARRALPIRAAARGALSTKSSRILKPWPVRLQREFLEQRARQHEEAAHRIAQMHGRGSAAPARTAAGVRDLVSPDRLTRQPALSPPATWRLRDDKVVAAGAQRRQHEGQAGLVVLQIAVDHREYRRRKRTSAPSMHRGGEATPADPADAASPWAHASAIRLTSAAVPSGLSSST